MKVTWKEGSETHTAEGKPEELASHLAYLDALDIAWETAKATKKEQKEVEDIVNSQDDSE